MCRSFGGRSRMNRYLNPETYERHLTTVDGPLAKFTGEVAFEQLADELDFVKNNQLAATSTKLSPGQGYSKILASAPLSLTNANLVSATPRASMSKSPLNSLHLTTTCSTISTD